MLGVPFLDDIIFKLFKPQVFDDSVDRMNYFITSTLLTFFAIMVSAKQYVGSPIQCWMPMEFKGGWEQYAEDYCFIQNTFFVPFHKDIPADIDDRSEAEIGYYQWVPIALALMAIGFYIPNWLWKTLHQQSGIDLSTAVSDARSMRATGSSDRSNDVKRLAEYLEETLEFNKSRRSPYRLFCLRMGTGRGAYVSMLYLVTKFLYLLNILIQFWALNSFLGSDYNFWGIQTFNDLWNGREWLESGVFPRVTLCDFKVRRLANIHRYTVQCVLMINMFNEKIFLFIWFWFLAVGICTLINFFYCLFQLAPPSSRMSTVKRLLAQSPYGDDSDYARQHAFRKFVDAALKPDGVLLLRFVEGHAGAIVARELTEKLFVDFLEGERYPNPGHHSAHTTKTVSPGMDGLHEELYNNPKMGLMAPDYPTKEVV